MKCPLCKTKMTAEVCLTGGCSGHNEDCRCYCSDQDAHVEFVCPNNVEWVVKEVSPRKWRTVKNKNYCKQQNLKIGELSDHGSMTRWLTENYTPGPNANVF